MNKKMENWYRVIGLVVTAHIIMFFVELYRYNKYERVYKKIGFNWYDYIKKELTLPSCILITFDLLTIYVIVFAWAVKPLMV